ncbi:MAG: nickel pincer cofactor biosynthesis protein LarC [Lachnospiraceae bacterium]|nr:nickel pincer cofactor biosynthesis protein LarC [Lachnospiraceae bacterium]
MENRILYLECASGISGDMVTGAMLDLGADREAMERALASLSLSGYRTEIGRVKKAGLDACDFRVILDEAHENHDHDMEYLHGTGGEPALEGGHPGDHTHHEHHAHHAHHEHRGLPEIMDILKSADLSPSARRLAEQTFLILAEAEAAAHGVPRDQVHFHEVGAVDSIVDIVAAAVCIDSLQIEDVVIGPLREGHGTVRCQHGILPVPVPAVTNIVSAYDLPVEPVDVEGELVTPTGAALAAAMRTRGALPARYRIRRVGMGAGKRTYSRPSLLRAMILAEETPAENASRDIIVKLETNVDDCTGETLGYAMEQLFAAGARDAFFTPIYMKKNRPAWQITVICREDERMALEEILFRETSTIGIRRVQMERSVMDRMIMPWESSLGKIDVKLCRRDGILRAYPEYESLRLLCAKTGLPYPEVSRRVVEELGNELVEQNIVAEAPAHDE